MALSDIQLEQIFLSALESPHGIIVETNSVELLKKQCYSVRAKARKAGELHYDSLSFRTSPTNPLSELWITLGASSNAS
jgi:hypothetical protein